MTNNNPWDRAVAQLDRAAGIVGLEKELKARLSKADMVIAVDVPVVMDSGETQVFHGYRVQHNNILGPYKGGLRYHPAVDLDEAQALAFWMTMKCALLGLPFGGGKGGVEVDPKKLSLGELERLTRSFTFVLAPHIGPEKDVPAPDVNTNSQMMEWIVDEYSKIAGVETPAVVTGKPIARGGSEGRTEATGLGGSFVLLAMLSKLGRDPRGMTVAIQGFGNVGSFFAERVQAAGMKVVALSDSKSAVYVPEGIDVKKAESYKKDKGTFEGFGQAISAEELLALPVDVVVPAALENAITEENAHSITAKIILELANGPTTLEADAILRDKKILVIPDILANAGGVVVSYFEWLQNRSDQKWSVEVVRTELQKKMDAASSKVHRVAGERGISLRDAAYVVALENIRDRIGGV